MSQLGNIRGAAVDEFLAWYAAERDAEQLVATVRAVPSALQEKIRWEGGRPRLIPFAWYPCELMHAVFDELLRNLDLDAREQLAREVADQVMKTTLNGVYKAMFKAIVSPALYAKVSPRLWRLYYDSGKSTVHIESDTRHRWELAGWQGHHPFLCAINRYCSDWIYRELRCAGVRSRPIKCMGRGSDICSFVTTWT